MTMNIHPSEIRVLEDHEIDLIVGGTLRDADNQYNAQLATMMVLPFSVTLALVNGLIAGIT